MKSCVKSIALILFVAYCCFPACFALPLPFTVADKISMVRPDYDVLPVLLSQQQTAVLRPESSSKESPRIDPQDKVVAVLRQSDLRAGFRTDSLISFDVSDVLNFVNTPERTQLPRYEILLRFNTVFKGEGSNSAFQQLRWLPKSRQLVFLGFRKEADDIGQVYRFDLKSRQLEQLTHSPTTIKTYSFSQESKMLVYAARSVPRREGARPNSYVVGASRDKRNGIMTTIVAQPDDREEVTYFAVNLQTGGTVRIESDEPQVLTGFASTPIYISPSGRWAIRRVGINALPDHWAGYDTVRQSHDPANSAPLGWRSSEEAFGIVAARIQQFQMMDLQRGTTRPLIDAPATEDPDTEMGDFTVEWTLDGKSAILSGTHLPFKNKDAAGRTRAEQTSAIAEVDLETGKTTSVMELPRDGRAPQLLMESNGALLTWEEKGTATYLMRRLEKINAVWTQTSERTYRDGDLEDMRKKSTHLNLRPWSPVKGPTSLAMYPRIRSYDNAPDAPSELEAADPVSGRIRTVTNLNPTLKKKFELGRLEKFEWTDRLGARWKTGLLWPSAAKAGHRYPVILQPYGFEEYSLDGDHPSYPGRLAASRDTLLLEIHCEIQEQPELSKRYAFNPEFGRFRSFDACIDGAIDALDAKGWIDRNRVGLIGFSALGNYVYHSVAFAQSRIAAATVVDSIQSSLWVYSLSYGWLRPVGMMSWDTPSERNRGMISYIGTPFYGAGIERWLQRSPMFHLDRIRTPLLLEAHGTLSPAPSWDTYSILKRQQRPVEMKLFPEEAHSVGTPGAAYEARTNMLDWFDFWLKDEEDPDPAKAARYDRWRLLRRQHQAHLAERQQAAAQKSTSAPPKP